MEIITSKTEDTGHEKHKPVMEKGKNVITVKIGSIAHPMEENHFIEWIELITAEKIIYRKYLKPGNLPEAKFECIGDVELIRSYCNIHGLWEIKI